MTHSELPWLDERTILRVRHGSHAYGTSVPTSDVDEKGVAVAPRAYYHGFSKVFEQAESKDPDAVVYELKKFLRLAAESNPNIIEVLWVDDRDVLRLLPAGAKLRDARAQFLSRRVRHTFSGYAASQLKRIKTHRRWLLDPPTAPPSRTAFGLPERTIVDGDQLAAAEAAVRKQIDRWELDLSSVPDEATRIAVLNQIAQYLTELEITDETRARRAGILLGYDTNFLDALDRERKYHVAQTQWETYQRWKRERNPARAALEAKHGYDTKHGMHLVRLLRMCREILIEGVVHVRRPDADELRAIRAGAWPYEQLIEWAEAEDRAMEALATASPLPKSPDIEALDALCVEIVEMMP
jgi:predicted nucleotidyltransferase